MKALKVIRESSGLYPISAYWIVASVVVAVAVEGWISLGIAIVILGIAAVIGILLTSQAELKQIHRTNTETLMRMARLEKVLTDAGITLPPIKDPDV